MIAFYSYLGRLKSALSFPQAGPYRGKASCCRETRTDCTIGVAVAVLMTHVRFLKQPLAAFESGSFRFRASAAFMQVRGKGKIVVNQ